MNGNDLLKAMDYVEEHYVAEAENVGLRKKRPLGWISVAACLCILIGGAMLWVQPETTNDCAMPESNGGAIVVIEPTLSPADGLEKADGDSETEAAEAPCVHVRILAWTEDGFTGLVECEPHSDTFAAGTELTVRFDADTSVMLPAEDGIQRWEDRWPAAEDFPGGTLVCVQFGTVLADGSIVAAVVSAAEEECV